AAIVDCGPNVDSDSYSYSDSYSDSVLDPEPAHAHGSPPTAPSTPALAPSLIPSLPVSEAAAAARARYKGRTRLEQRLKLLLSEDGASDEAVVGDIRACMLALEPWRDPAIAAALEAPEPAPESIAIWWIAKPCKICTAPTHTDSVCGHPFLLEEFELPPHQTQLLDAAWHEAVQGPRPSYDDDVYECFALSAELEMMGYTLEQVMVIVEHAYVAE
ncbi:hypothetical protein H4R19_005557, partial [Coemansia spiralis]